MSVAAFRFQPPNRRQVWKELALTMSQASALTGVSERQIQHWMDRGYIRPAMDGARKISGETLDVIMLIKQARSAGIPLRQAVPMAHAYLDREASGALDSQMAQWALHDLQQRLESVQLSIGAVQQLIRSVDSTDGHLAAPPLPAMANDGV